MAYTDIDAVKHSSVMPVKVLYGWKVLRGPSFAINQHPEIKLNKDACTCTGMHRYGCSHVSMKMELVKYYKAPVRKIQPLENFLLHQRQQYYN